MNRKLSWKTKKYRAKLVALSPIHIGTGEPVPACRYVVPSGNGDMGYCLKESFVAKLLVEGKISTKQYMENPFRKDDPVFGKDFDPKNRFYELDFTKAARDLNKEAQPFIRDAFGRAYLPGSSIKGMLRTSLAFSFLLNEPEQRKSLIKDLEKFRPPELLEKMRNVNKSNIREIRKRNDNRAARIESFFRASSGSKERPNPQNDILKALKVSDSAPADRPLVMAATNIFTSRNGALEPLSRKTPPAFCEVAEPGTVFSFDITIDEALLETMQQAFNPAVRIRNHIDLLSAMQDHAAVINRFEKAFLEENDAEVLWDEKYEKESDGAVVRIGWGSGWIGASLFPVLAYDPEKETASRPLSRKTVVSSKGDPKMLLGWGRLFIDEAPEK
jgi:CRISPR-associated protein Csm5